MAQSLEYNSSVSQVVPIAVPSFEGDTEIIQALDDEPNDVGGLTAQELKERFDHVGTALKEYINGDLVPAVLSTGLTEQARQDAEGERVANEIERVNAERERLAAEEERIEGEADRDETEHIRMEAETRRIAAEEERREAEGARSIAETERKTAEEERKRAEDERKAAEELREDAERGYVAQAQAYAGEAAVQRSAAQEARLGAEEARDTAMVARTEAEAAAAGGEEARDRAVEARIAAGTAADRAEAARDRAERAGAGLEEVCQAAQEALTGAEAAAGRAENWAETAREIAIGDVPTRREAKGYVEDHDKDPQAHDGTLARALETAQRAMKAVQRVAYVIDTLPYQTMALTFTGEEQSPVWGAFDPEKLEISGVTSAVNAGEYEAVFTPKGDYVWTDETTEAKAVTWSIGRAVVAAAPSVAGSLTYTGAAQSPVWNGYDNDKLELGGETSGVNAGSYTASFTPTANYQWSDGTTVAKTVSWTIGRAAVAVPSQSGSRTYNGKAQSPAWSNYDANKLTIGGTTSGTNAGSYNAVFTPKANYCWSDGTTGSKTVSWTIGKAAGSLTLNKTSLALSLTAKTGTITVTRGGTGAITASSSNTNIATVSVSGNTVTVTAKANGTVTVTVSVGADANYNAPANKTCTVAATWPSATLNSNSWAVIREVSDAGQGANFWKVGDTKSITINGKVGNTTFSNLAIDVFILGFNHNSSREGVNRIHFQIGKIGGKLVGLVDGNYDSSGYDAKNFQMNDSDTNSGGWSGSSMRKTLLGNSKTPTSPLANSFMAALPADLRAVMKSVIKYSDNTGGGSDVASYVTATTDYLFLLAEFEYHGVRTNANSAEKNYQAQYDYYKAGNTTEHKKYNATSTAAGAWCRSVSASNFRYFCLVTNNGGTHYGNANDSIALAPGFCV